MASALDSIRDSWDRKNPSEQRLMVIFGLVMVGIVIFLMVEKVSSGMARLESENAQAREALHAMSRYRHIQAKAKMKGARSTSVDIPETAIALDVYLNGILKEMSIQSPSFPEVRENPVGKFIELSFEVSLKGLNIGEVGELLERVETGSQLVVVKELNLDTNFRDREKLDLEVTIANYKKKAEKSKKGKDDDGDDDGDEEDS